MVRMRTRMILAAAALGLLITPTAASAQLEERLDALDTVLPQLYDGEPVTLGECLEVGEVASMDLAGFQEDVGVAETDKTAAWLQWLPSLTVSANWQRSERTDYDVDLFEDDDMDNVVGPSMYLRLAERQSRMEGFAFFHFPDRLAEAAADLGEWLADGSLVAAEEILDGIERYPEALSHFGRPFDLACESLETVDAWNAALAARLAVQRAQVPRRRRRGPIADSIVARQVRRRLGVGEDRVHRKIAGRIDYRGGDRRRRR